MGEVIYQPTFDQSLPYIAIRFGRFDLSSRAVEIIAAAMKKNPELPYPAEMSPAERAAEITAILAAAIVRTALAEEAKQRSGDLDFLLSQRLHTPPDKQEDLQ